MRLADEVVDRLAEPVVPPGPPGPAVHALLDDAPRPVGGEEEVVVVDLVAVLHGGGVDPGAHPGRADEALAPGDGQPLGAVGDLPGRPAARRPLAAGHDEAQVVAVPARGLLHGAPGDGGQARAVPVEAQHAAEGLEPPRVGEAAEHLPGPVLLDHRHRDGAREAGHPVEEPARGPAAVQRQLGDAPLHGPGAGATGIAPRPPDGGAARRRRIRSPLLRVSGAGGCSRRGT